MKAETVVPILVAALLLHVPLVLALGGEHDGFLALLQLVALPGEFGKALRSID